MNINDIFIDQIMIDEVLSLNTLNNDTQEYKLFRGIDSKFTYFLLTNLNNGKNKITDLNWLKEKDNRSINLTEQELELIYQNIDKINNHFIQSKLYDYFWANKYNNENIFKDYDKARELYLKELNYIIDTKLENYDYFYRSLQRYLSLSCKLTENCKPKYIDECYNNIKTILQKIETNNLTSYISHCIRILSNRDNLIFIGYFFKKEQILDKLILNKYLKLLNDLINQEKNFYLLENILNNIKQIIKYSEPYFKTNQKIHIKLINIINKKIFNNYINITNSRDDNFGKSIWLKKALDFCRNNNMNKNLLNIYGIKYREIKKNIEFNTINLNDTEIYDSLEKAYNITVNEIKNYNFSEKVNYIALKTYNFLQTEEKFKEKIDDNKTIADMLGFQTLNQDINGNTSNIDNGKISKFLRYFSSNCIILNSCYINPVLENIIQNYPLNEETFTDLVHNNNFIPEWHEVFFEKSLYYFFEHKFIEAFHILIPQIENSLRYVIIKNNFSTTIQNGNGTEKERIDMEELINICKNNNIIDKKICFYFDLLLNSKYYNIRNNLAHGFDTEYSYLTPIYNVFICLLIYLLNNQKN